MLWEQGKGVEQIIGHFLAYAVDIARVLFRDERLVALPEVEIPSVEAPEIGKIHGHVSYSKVKHIR